MQGRRENFESLLEAIKPVEHTLQFVDQAMTELFLGFPAALVLMIRNNLNSQNDYDILPSKYLLILGLGYGVKLADALYKDFKNIDFPMIKDIQEEAKAKVQSYLDGAKRRGWFGFFCRECAVLTASTAVVLADSMYNPKGP